MIKQEWEGRDLDKDILNPNNKIYSPDTCVFVTSAINRLILDRAEDRGKYPQGVSHHKVTGKYQAELSVDSKTQYLGLHDTPEEASEVYKIRKSNHIRSVALEQAEPLRSALMKHADSLYVSFL
jgi:hypothetical protein